MRHILVASLLTLLASMSSGEPVDADTGANDRPDAQTTALRQKQWLHGAADCKTNTDPAIEVFQADPSSYILRQNKCLNYEAPFIYVLFGEDKALVLDTGATESAADFPLYQTVQALVEQQPKLNGADDREVLVIHSHSHRDHYAGDAQFDDKPNVTLIAPNKAAVTAFFAFDRWPEGEANIDLGGRMLTVIPTPGHQEESISVYDPQTQWLLTGDSLYPGYVYVKHWDAYKNSIARMVAFASRNDISAVLGTHIEMTNEAGEYYPIGTTFQPNEASLVLEPGDLTALHAAISALDKPQKITFNAFIVAPMNPLQKLISNVARWIIQ